MAWNLMFFCNSFLLGVGLTMDAFSVSVANALREPHMKKRKMCGIAGVFAAFQALMPLLGWICVHTIVQYFAAFEKWIPWIALCLLLWIGGGMIREGMKRDCAQDSSTFTGVGIASLCLQGIATSIDALSVGFTIAEYRFPMALAAALIIAAVTFVICFCGCLLGKKFGEKLSDKAQIFGGVILILIGIEIFVTGILG